MEERAVRERKKAHLKTSILFVCKSLASLGIGGLTPEDVRQAKFDKEKPRINLWKALHDLVVLFQNNFCRKVAKALKAQEIKQVHVVVEYAALQLSILGCPFVHAFCSTSKVGSRRLLLALTWLMAKTNVVERIMERAVDNLEKTSLVTNGSSIHPEDTLFCHHTLERCEKAYQDAEKYMNEVRKEAQGHKFWHSVDLRANQVLLLAGKVRAQLNAFLSSQSGYIRKTNRLKKSQLPPPEKPSAPGSENSSSSDAISCFDVFVVANRDRLDAYAKHLEGTVQTMVFLKDFAFHVHEFLNWIASVKELYVSEELAQMGERGLRGEERETLRNEFAGLVQREQECFQILEGNLQDKTLSHVQLHQSNNLISDSFQEMADTNSRAEEGVHSQREFSVDVLSFLVQLQRGLGAQVKEPTPDQGGVPNTDDQVEEDLHAYRDTLVSLSKAQAGIRSQQSIQLKQTLDYMEKLNITQGRGKTQYTKN